MHRLVNDQHRYCISSQHPGNRKNAKNADLSPGLAFRSGSKYSEIKNIRLSGRRPEKNRLLRCGTVSIPGPARSPAARSRARSGRSMWSPHRRIPSRGCCVSAYRHYRRSGIHAQTKRPQRIKEPSAHRALPGPEIYRFEVSRESDTGWCNATEKRAMSVASLSPPTPYTALMSLLSVALSSVTAKAIS